LDYTSDSRFDGLYLEDSFFIEFRHTGNAISLGLEFHLTKEHPSWSPPLEGEWGCYKRGWMHFAGVTKVKLAPSNSIPAIDADGEHDFGTLDVVKIEGSDFLIESSWGVIQMAATKVQIEFEEC
jgi:hypothetical protein